MLEVLNCELTPFSSAFARAHPESRASSLVFTSPEVIAASTPELKN
jgi:hypothetical protein